MFSPTMKEHDVLSSNKSLKGAAWKRVNMIEIMKKRIERKSNGIKL
jgi:hypothetical protein